MRNIFILLTLIFLSGCFKKHPDVTVINKSDKYFDSIHVYASPNQITSFKNIKPKSLCEGKILFDSSITSDGAYVIHTFQDLDTTMTYSFGYFTNGHPLNNAFKIEVFSDTIKVVEN